MTVTGILVVDDVEEVRGNAYTNTDAIALAT
jgi:hypothetical protein